MQKRARGLDHRFSLDLLDARHDCRVVAVKKFAEPYVGCFQFQATKMHSDLAWKDAVLRLGFAENFRGGDFIKLRDGLDDSLRIESLFFFILNQVF